MMFVIKIRKAGFFLTWIARTLPGWMPNMKQLKHELVWFHGVSYSSN
jgi:hypothetical protein